MPPKIGLLLPTREAILSGKHDAGAMLALAEQAEAAGFDSVWVGDSLLARPRFEPLTLLGAVAGRTRRVQLGTAVLIAPLRNPVLLAHSAATLDRISEGRLILGMGFASRGAAIQQEFQAAGADYEHRGGRMAELMQLCRLLWSGQPVDFSGKYYQVRQATLLPTPHRPGGPPLWIGGSGPLSLKLTGQLGDGYFPIGPTAEAVAGYWQKTRQIAAQAGRPPPLLAFYATLNVNSDAAQAQRELVQFMERYYPASFAQMSKRQGCYAGPASDCAQWLAGFAAKGAEHVVLRLASFDQAVQFQRVVKDLLPLLHKLKP